MRKMIIGLVVAIGLSGVSLAQNNNPAQPATSQAQNAPGQSGQLRPGQNQQGQVGQPNQLNQSGQTVGQRPYGQTNLAGQQGQATTSDQQIAACVYGACHNEIEIAKFAESKASSDEAREFAQQMVREHTPGCEAMQRLAGNLVAETANQPHAGGGLDWISIHKQIGQQCLASTKQELSQKQGVQFDKCFMGQQIGEHLKVIDSLKVLRNYASSGLQKDLDHELQLAQQHLQKAKQIEDQLQNRPSERVSRRPDGTK